MHKNEGLKHAHITTLPHTQCRLLYIGSQEYPRLSSLWYSYGYKYIVCCKNADMGSVQSYNMCLSF